MDLSKLMKQAKKMQDSMLKQQAELEKKTYEGVAGGVVRVKVNGAFEPVSVKIDPEVVDPEDVETLEEMVTMALKSAIGDAKKDQEAAMKGMTAGMGLPGLPF